MQRIFIFLLLFSYSLHSQIYDLNQNESLFGASIKSEENYLFIIKSLSNTYTQNIEEYALYVNGQKKSSFTEVSYYNIREDKNALVIGRRLGEVSNLYSVLFGDKEKTYDNIDRLNESPDEKSLLAFMRLFGKGYALFIDTDIKEIAEYDELYASSISKKGSHYAFSIKREDKYYIVIDGIEKEIEGAAEKIILSEDGTKVSYTIKNEGLYFIAINENKFGPYKYISSFAISPNNEYFAYAAVQAPEESITNMEQEPLQIQTQNNKSEDKYILSKVTYGNKVEFGIIAIDDTMPIQNTNETNSIEENKGFHIIMNEREYQTYDKIYDMSFSPDSKTLSFIAEKNNKFYMVSGGNMSAPYKKIEYYMFSDNSFVMAYYGDRTLMLNSKTIAQNIDIPYIYYLSKDMLIYECIKYNKHIIVSPGYESALYDKITGFLYDNNKYAFTALRGGKYYVVDTKREEKGPYVMLSKQNKTEKGYIAIASDESSVYIVLSE